MSTNYYVGSNYCNHCKRYDTELHIGKSSMGWCFLFRGYKHLKLVSWQRWKDYLQNKQIYTEYSDLVDYKDFVRLIETYKHPNYISETGQRNLQHNVQARLHQHFNPKLDWDDGDSFPFTAAEFS